MVRGPPASGRVPHDALIGVAGAGFGTAQLGGDSSKGERIPQADNTALEIVLTKIKQAWRFGLRRIAWLRFR